MSASKPQHLQQNRNIADNMALLHININGFFKSKIRLKLTRHHLRVTCFDTKERFSVQLIIDQDRHKKIRQQLRAVGSSFSKVARELQLSPVTVVTASLGRCTSRRVEEAIAQKLATTPEELWPERHRSKGAQVMNR